MSEHTPPKGASVPDAAGDGRDELAEVLANALCDRDLDAGDVLVLTERDGVEQRKLTKPELDSLLERALVPSSLEDRD